MNKEYVFTIKGKPISDTRPRASRGRIYDPRHKEKKRIKKLLKEVVSKTDYEIPVKYNSQKDTTNKKIHDVNYLEIEIHTYIKYPKKFSKYLIELAKEKLVRPGGRPDMDNYIKLYLDVSHGILFEDDSVVVNVIGKKYYAVDEDEHVDMFVRKIDVPKID
jgi:Holliday junction resolvase RusA-like endonuclease